MAFSRLNCMRANTTSRLSNVLFSAESASTSCNSSSECTNEEMCRKCRDRGKEYRGKECRGKECRGKECRGKECRGKEGLNMYTIQHIKLAGCNRPF